MVAPGPDLCAINHFCGLGEPMAALSALFYQWLSRRGANFEIDCNLAQTRLLERRGPLLANRRSNVRRGIEPIPNVHVERGSSDWGWLTSKQTPRSYGRL
jgi:hypothetical protein